MQPARRTTSEFGRSTFSRSGLFLAISRIAVVALGKIIYPAIYRFRDVGASREGPKHLLIGAGVKGWELIEYQEIYESACEFMGVDKVSRLTFSSNRRVVIELREALQAGHISHYYFDPRSGSQAPLRAVLEATMIFFLLARHQVTPICALTDFPVRRWRLQTAIVSAGSGLVTSLMAPKVVEAHFPHARVIGPMPLPLSVRTLRRLESLKRNSNPALKPLRNKVVFVGLLYEPRKTTLEEIQRGLARRGITMEIIGRRPDGARISDADYWQIVSNARLVVSTSSQIAGPHTDFDGHNHFVYKFIEVTAAGTALAIEPVDGADHLLNRDVDYISYTSAQEAIDRISLAWQEPTVIAGIARRGHKAARALTESHYFWQTVSRELGADGLITVPENG